MKKDSRQTETEADEKRGKGQERRQRLGNRWIERTHKGESGKGGGTGMKELVSDRVRKRKAFNPPVVSGGCC